MARFDVDRIRIVVGWPIREGLLAYIDLSKRRATEAYRHDVADFRRAQMVYLTAKQGPNNPRPTPPVLPEILRVPETEPAPVAPKPIKANTHPRSRKAK